MDVKEAAQKAKEYLATPGEGSTARSYKVVRIHDHDGRVLSVKDRVLTASE